MPRASAEAAARTATVVLAAATELFTEQGYADVSLEDVAKAAEVTRGAVYHHYGNKITLFRAIVAGVQARVAEAVVAAAERAGTDPEAQLRAGSHAFLDAITDAPAARVLLVDAPSVIGWAEWRRYDAQHSAAHLRDALAELGVPEALLDAATVQLSGAMNEAALWLAERHHDGPGRAAAHRVLDGVLDSAIALSNDGHRSNR